MPLWSNTGSVNARPTWANTDNSRTYGNTYPVLPGEVDTTATKTQDIHAGWVSGKAYVDKHGDRRYKFETLVAMKSLGNSVIYSLVPLTGHINVATASAVVLPAITRTNTKLVGKIATVANSMMVVGTGTKFQADVVPGSWLRWNGIRTGRVNTVISNTSLHLKAVASFANANSLFYKIVDTRDTAFSTELAVNSQVKIGSLVRTVSAVNSSQITLNTTVGSTSANTTFSEWTNVTGNHFFHV